MVGNWAEWYENLDFDATSSWGLAGCHLKAGSHPVYPDPVFVEQLPAGQTETPFGLNARYKAFERDLKRADRMRVEYGKQKASLYKWLASCMSVEIKTTVKSDVAEWQRIKGTNDFQSLLAKMMAASYGLKDGPSGAMARARLEELKQEGKFLRFADFIAEWNQRLFDLIHADPKATADHFDNSMLTETFRSALCLKDFEWPLNKFVELKRPNDYSALYNMINEWWNLDRTRILAAETLRINENKVKKGRVNDQVKANSVKSKEEVKSSPKDDTKFESKTSRKIY